MTDLAAPPNPDHDDRYCEDDDDPWNEPAAACKYCHGTGGDSWNNGITPCEHCEGEGYEWWK
jgi:cytochrome c553